MRIQLWKARGIPGYLLHPIDEETGTYDAEQSILIQTDWDYPSLASSFGFVPCSCGETDGTVDCPHKKSSEIMRQAQDWLDERIGTIVQDPGYFS